jgi:hypothetical protein
LWQEVAAKFTGRTISGVGADDGTNFNWLFPTRPLFPQISDRFPELPHFLKLPATGGEAAIFPAASIAVSKIIVS